MRTRLFDVAVACLGLVLGAPLWAAVAAAVRLDSDGPVLHRARRMGRHGTTVTVLKFRTMVLDAPGGPAVTASGDDRVTRIGRVLRATKLDEVPQLLNVVAGDMGLVGPRPEDPRYLEVYSEDQRRVLLGQRPGITSPASVAYRHEEAVLAGADDVDAAYRSQVLPAKLVIDTEYFARRSLTGDLGVIWATVVAVARRRPVEL
jgi:lipopolysaccharide/colanic/teichoic acid biosynthesis glycosyltransferase